MEFESIDVENYSFDVVRKGYDRLQVEDFLTKVSRSMARLEERRKLAEVRTEKAERELTEVHARAAATIQETVAARAQLLASAANLPAATDTTDDTPVYATERAQIEAQRIIEQANNHATSIHAEAEAVLAGALSTSAKINDDRSEVLGSVSAEREALLATAKEEAERVKAEAATRAEEIRRQAESDATELLGDARARSVEITAHAERNRAELAASAERSRSAAAGVARSGGDPLSDPAPAPVHDPDTDEADLISLDLRDDAAERELEPVLREPRASRYKSRSANLPSLGDDAGSVIGGLESLRTKDE